jgi:anti-anti-sigma factor
MLTQVADARTVEEATAVAGAQDDLQEGAPLVLSHRISPAGEAVVDIGGELDITTAEPAARYVSQVIDRYRRPVIVDLTTLGFCDASGLSSLLRMARDAQQAGCPFRLASPSPSLVKIMRITGLHHRFLPPAADRRFLRTPASRAQTRQPERRRAGHLTQPARQKVAYPMDLAGHPLTQ